MNQRRSHKKTRIIPAVVVLLLLVAMALSTKVLSAAEVAKLNPPPFTASGYASKTLPEIVTYVAKAAHEMPQVAAAADKDKTAAGASLGTKAPGATNSVIPVKFSGSVLAADATFVTVKVTGVPESDQVRIAVGQNINGTALRDATGKVQFGDFDNQTQYQDAANALRGEVSKTVAPKLTSVKPGQTVTVTGVYSAGPGPKGLYIVTPVTAEVK